MNIGNFMPVLFERFHTKWRALLRAFSLARFEVHVPDDGEVSAPVEPELQYA